MVFLKKNIVLNLSKFFFLLLIFLVCCSQKLEKQERTEHLAPSCREISEDDKNWMEKFFTDFFLEGSAIYTLFGTKPMSQITIVRASEQEWIESAGPHLRNEGEKKKKEIVQKIKKHYQKYDLPQNWEKWITWKKKCSHSSFLFSQRSVPGNDKLFNVYIINVPEVAWTLQKHYSLFSRELKMEFDPIDAALEFDNSHSMFWDKVFANHLLQGILHGFGEKNAYFFSRQFANEKNHEKTFDNCIFEASPSEKNEKEGETLKDMRLPFFRSYSFPYDQDPVMVHYEKERKRIQNRLKGKNLVKEILNRLCRCPTACPDNPSQS